MSWFADLAGKAESLLEKVDKTAANALHVDKGVGSEPSSDVKEVHRDAQANVVSKKYGGNSDYPVSGAPQVNVNIINDRSSSPKTSSNLSRASSQTNIGQKKNDDQLFEFLNSSPPGGDKKNIANQLRSTSPIQTSSPKMPKLNNAALSEQNKRSNLIASGNFPERETSYQSDESVDVIDASPSHSTDALNIVPTRLPRMESIQMTGAAQPAGNAQQPARVSNLELENQLLRKEVNSLNEELLALAHRSKEAQERFHSSERESEKLHTQLKKEENLIRELQSHDDDIREALGAKDSQLAVLRIRIQESDQELKETKGKLQSFQNENERILRDHSDSSGIQHQVLDDLKARLQEAEIALKHEQDYHEQTRTEGAERQGKLETEQRSMAEAVKTLQKNIVDVKRNANECASKLKVSENKLSMAKQEMRDYKEKAGRILQAKEKVITSLKGGKSIMGDSSGITTAEFEVVCQEKDVLRDELYQTKYAIEQMKVDIQELEQQLQSESELAQEQTEHLQSLLEQEGRLKEEANHDVLKTREELQATCDDHYRQKTTLITQIHEREGEIEKLKSQLLAKSYTTTSEAELEKRVRALTENLIQKQTVIEALSTEKSSLVLQLERLEIQYKDIQRSTSRVATSTAAVRGFDTADETARVHSISSIMPSQITESAKVNKAVNEIDKCSIRLGLFLRRYPIARLMLIVYMILLHLWVFIVLLTYQPEVHVTSPAGPMPKNPHPD